MSKKKFRITRKTILREIIKNNAEIKGDKLFLTYIRDFDKGIDEKYTYKDLHLQSNRLGNGLLKLGIKKGEGIALMEINSPEYIFSIYATFKMGAYIVLVNTGLKGDGLKYILDHSDSSSIIIHWSLIKEFLEIKSQLSKLKRVIIDINEAPEEFKIPEGTISLQEVMQSSDDDINIEISLDDLSMLMYTAGTTGLPKAIMFWQGRLLGGFNIQTLMKIIKILIKPNDVVYTSLPLFHSNALFLSTFATYLNENPLILAKKFSASRHWDICRKYHVTTFNTLGAMTTILMKQPERPNDKDHEVEIVNSAACPKELWKAFEKRFNVRIEENYGATDGGGFMLITKGNENLPVGTMGKPLAGTIAEIMDDEGIIIPEPDQIGELVFLIRESELKSREVNYYKDEEASKSLVQKGADGQFWFHTGDLATKDKDGWFYFVDRKKDSIRRRGENIATFSIESIIDQNEKVLESAAFGIKSELGEDDVMVSVMLKKGATMTPEELLDFCRNKMADFMIPRYIDFVDTLPKSEVHRTLKMELKKRGATENTYDREKAGYSI